MPRKAPAVHISANGRDLGNYFEQVSVNYSPVSNPFVYYRTLVEGIQAIKNLEILPLYQLLSPIPDGRRVVGLRHDIDADPVTALRCARYLAQHGLCGSFYMLHTALYYGEFYGDSFVRTSQLGAWIRGFIVAGCELGLHNDALGVCMNSGRDGVQALQDEIAFFRSYGVRIKGTVAHNSGPVYGAENFEIFRGMVLWSRIPQGPNGIPLPLGRVNPATVGLEYEGTFAKPKTLIDNSTAGRFFADRKSANLQSEMWMKTYLLCNPCCDWGIDYQYWLLGKDKWVVAGSFKGDIQFDWGIGLDQVLRHLEMLPTGSRSVLVVHPELVGARA